MKDKSHPVYSGRYRLLTPSVQKSQAAIQQWIHRGVIGGFLWGMPRCGKTTFLEEISQMLKTRSGEPIHALLYNTESAILSNERKFWMNMAFAANLDFSGSRRSSATALKFLIAEALFEAARQNSERRVVLLVDEAQKLLVMHYEFLIDLGNALRFKSVEMSTFLVGSEYLPTTVSTLKHDDIGHLHGRFFVDSMRFRGLSSEADCRQLLKQYDESLHYPSKDGPTFTEHFFPRAFRNGERLADLAGAYWDAAKMRCREIGCKDLPTQYFCRSIEYLLIRGLTDKSSFLDQTDKCIEALNYAGFNFTNHNGAA